MTGAVMLRRLRASSTGRGKSVSTSWPNSHSAFAQAPVPLRQHLKLAGLAVMLCFRHHLANADDHFKVGIAFLRAG